MPIRPAWQARHQDYVLGPNQDSRLASVAPGAEIKGIELLLDPDAPFCLRGRAVRQAYTSSLTQAGLQFIATKWTGQRGKEDYRHQDYVLESLQMPNFGQLGNPKPIWPNITYPANGLIVVDLKNFGASTITNLTFYWRGVKLFPWGAVPAYTYPPTFRGLGYQWQIPVAALGVSELRQNNILLIDQEDFVFKAGQATAPFQIVGDATTRTFAEVGIIWKDEQRKPYSNDFIPLDVMFGAASWPATIPLGKTPSFISPYGPGPGLPGLEYPEMYIPLNHQIYYDLQRSDGAVSLNQPENFKINLVGQRIYPGAR